MKHSGAIAIGAVSAGALEGAAIASIFIGRIGRAILGADGYTWDGWKPVVMDNLVGASRGITLCDLYDHSSMLCSPLCLVIYSGSRSLHRKYPSCIIVSLGSTFTAFNSSAPSAKNRKRYLNA